MAGKLQDPADLAAGDKVQPGGFMPVEGDGFQIKFDDLKRIPESAARTPHPFEGYPLKPKVAVGKAKVSATFLVFLADPSAVPQDRSNRNRTHAFKGPDGSTIEKQITLKNPHSRRCIDYDGEGRSTDWVFDREFITADGKVAVCAIVPSHSARAQIFFSIDRKTNKVVVDPRYLLADNDQAGRLRNTFRNIQYQQLAGERAAQKFFADEGDPDRSNG